MKSPEQKKSVFLGEKKRLKEALFTTEKHLFFCEDLKWKTRTFAHQKSVVKNRNLRLNL
jgi:hypothetical protein